MTAHCTRWRIALIALTGIQISILLEEIKLILNMRHRNPNAGIVVFWVKLRSISGLVSLSPKTKFNGCKIAQSKEIHAKAL